MDILTKCVHAGGFEDELVGSVVTPIYTASSYRFNTETSQVCYPRYFNVPTHQAAAEKIAALENAESCLITSSGMGAISTCLLSLLNPGDHAVVQNDVYGGTFHLLFSDLSRLGTEITWVQGHSPADYEAAVKPNTRLIYFETPTNPLLKVVDIRGVAEMARRHGLVTIVDNTFASPINQNPLDMGIDVVIHSGTKYLGGHSDLCCGAVATRAELMDKIRHTAVNIGVTLGAFECYQLERSLKTLGLRVRQHNQNALALAEFLAKHPQVSAVYYPGLSGHPGHDIARSQMRGFGGMLSVELGDAARALQVVEKMKLFTHAVSLGGVESLVCFPSMTSHAKMPPEERAKLGITDGLVRISTGIEDTEDLIEDFRQALEN